MDQVVMITDLVWIPRGVPKEIPDKVKLTEEELKELIEGGVAETTDNDDSDNEKMEEDKPEAEAKGGLRGSAPDEITSDKEENIEEKYMKDFDEEDKEKGMRGIAVYASNKDDPYITEHVDSDNEDEDKDDFIIKPDDNLLAVAKIDKNEYTMEVYVYNETNGDFYCHHDYILEAPPLCIEPIFYDPGNDTDGKGNLVAVGTMESEIHIWDLDIVNSCTPFLTLGKKQKSKKRTKRDGSHQGHKDAVISLAWNKLMEHVMASGGADQQIILWDLDEAKPAQSISNRHGEVQSLAWHPIEATYILSGTMKGSVEVLDCREAVGDPSAQWSFETQIEKVIWNHFNPFYCFVGSDDGFVRYLDMRKPGDVIWEHKAHDGSLGGLILSTKIRGLLNSLGHDGILNSYKVDDDGTINKIHSVPLNLGSLHSAAFNPEVGTVLAAGGSEGDLLRLIDLTKHEAIVQSFQ